MQAACNTGTLQRLVLSILLAGLHQTRHLVLGELDLAATEGREADVSDLELVGGGRHVGGCLLEIERIWEDWDEREESKKKWGGIGF